MRRTRFTTFTSSLVALTHLVFSALVVIPGSALAQTIDVDPPTIELEAVNEGVRGETQVFSATVEDNTKVSSMTLHYRFGRDASYQSVPMSVIFGTSIYTASVDTSETTAGVIQYYMEARDEGGNRTVQGFAFDPFERTLLEESAIVADNSATTAGPIVPVVAAPMSTQRKIVYGVLGVLVLGGIAAAAGGGGSSGGGSTSPGQVDLTIFVDRFQ